MNIDTIETAAQSVTATVCENAALYGATPERGEFDSREVWDRDDATDAVSEAFRILAEGVAPDGFQLADERESLLWGFVNMLDAQVRRLDRSVDRLARNSATSSAPRTAPRSSRASWNWSPTGRGTSETGATRSRPCATRRRGSTAARPATHGGPGTAATPARPAS